MKTHTIKSRTMRTLLTILLLVSGFAFAQPSINNPTPLKVCDNNNDGFASFDLTSKNAEILGALNTLNHTISYHETLSDAQNNVNQIFSLYTNISIIQTLYVRVIENSNPTLFSTTTLTIEAVPLPVNTPKPNVTVCGDYVLPVLYFSQNYYTQPNGTGTLLTAGTHITTNQTIYIFSQSGTYPFCTNESSFTVTTYPLPTFSQPTNLFQNNTTGNAVFNLTVQNSLLLNGDPSRIINYYPSLFDLENNIYEIPNPSAFTNYSNPQTIFARVTNPATGCHSTAHFDLIVNTINNPTPLKVCDDNNDGFASFDLTSKNAEILGTLNPLNHTVSYHETLSDAQNNVNSLASTYTNLTNPQTVYVRLIENSSPTLFSTTTLTIEAVPLPEITTMSDVTVCGSYTLPILPFGQNYYTQSNGTGTLLAAGTAITTTQAIYIFSQSGTSPFCTNESSFTATVNQAPTVTISGGGNYFLNSSNVSATFTCLGGMSPFVISYSINGGALQNITTTGNTASIPIPTNILSNYVIDAVTISNNNGCTQNVSDSEIFNIVPITINNPTSLQVCDSNSDGFASFNLVSKNAEILGVLNPLDYTVSYHETYTDALAGSNSLSSPYLNTNPFNQSVYVRVTENANPTFFLTTDLTIQTISLQVIGLIPALTVYENPFDGVANFNLTLHNNVISTNVSNVINYYTTQVDAENQTNVISNPSSFTGTHLQTIWFSISNPSTTCTSEGSFTLHVVNSSLVVYIPDTHFKAKLIAASPSNTIASIGSSYVKIDVNNDNEIQFTEAALIDFLDVNTSYINDMTGIEAFTNLTKLHCNYNQIATINLTSNITLQQLYCGDNLLNTLDINTLTNLTVLNCKNNNLTTLNVTPLTNLTNLVCSENNLTTLDVTTLTNLTSLDCKVNNLTTLNVTTLTNLTNLVCSENNLTTLDVTTLTNLTSLDCSENNLTTLNVNTLTNLINLNCGYNNLTTINISNLSNLEIIALDGNQLSSLNLNNLMDLTQLSLASNQLTSLDVSTLPNLQTLAFDGNYITNVNFGSISNLQYIDCASNLLTSINLSNLTQLNHIEGRVNLFTTLDFSQNINLLSFQIDNCPNLETIFMKNGVINSNIPNYTGCPNLNYICADNNEILDTQILLTNAGNTTCVVNSYCSFTPGGNYNTLTGTATFDSNNNGCDALDGSFDLLGLKVSLNGVPTNSSVFTNNAGVYNLYTNMVGEYQLTPNFENPTYYNASPIVQAFPVINNSTAIQNICITANGVHHDLEIVIAPITPARPGFDAVYQIVYKNKGNQTLSGSFNFNFDDAKLDFISASIVPSATATGILTWNYTNLLPFENRTIYVTLNVNSPVEIPAVNIGEILTFSSTINPIIGDETPGDNTFNYNQIVVGSFDPNSIECLEGATVDPSQIGNYLHYEINFENTGSYQAENVVVKDIIDANLYDISSLQVLNTSHNSNIKITENVAEFIFENINLVAASGTPPVGGHGNVLFKIRSKNNLVAGDSVVKDSKIYFDYNAPVNTNSSQTTYITLHNSIVEFDESVKIYPNPTQSKININSNFNIKSVELYDIQGRILEKSFENSSTTTLNLSERQSGIYFVKITSDKGSKIEKVVKN